MPALACRVPYNPQPCSINNQFYFFVSISDSFSLPVGKVVRQQKTTNKIQPDCTCGLIMHCHQAQGMGKRKTGNKT